MLFMAYMTHLLVKFFCHTIFIYFLISGVPLGEACSIVLRGATEQIIGEAERSLHDALCVLTSTVKETKTTFGGGTFKYIHDKLLYNQSISSLHTHLLRNTIIYL